MNRDRQKKFVKELSANVIKELIVDIDKDKTPEDWDGLELRQLLADRFDLAKFSGVLTGKRKRTYKNTVLVNGL